MTSALQPSNLALFWAGVIAVAILVYVVLDGFDLGVGILFGFTRDEAQREQMMGSIAPFWDGNETWLVVIGASQSKAVPANCPLATGMPRIIAPTAAPCTKAAAMEPMQKPPSQKRRNRLLCSRNSKATPRKIRPNSSSSTGR